MSNLSERMKKAKELTWSFNPHMPCRYGTWGGKNGFGAKYYNVELSHTQEVVITPDSKKKISVLQVSCREDIGNGSLCNCQGNKRHTVCYHSLGALYESFKKSDKLISFFETYQSAVKMQFAGKVVKVASVNGPGYLWAVVKDWPKKVEILPGKDNIELMRGSEDDEGID